ncbi:MAG: hypothetical protein J6Q40_03095 [Tidjanibacter sp.]|nr:hypothetical protein [Tidjanibacter sp.]
MRKFFKSLLAVALVGAMVGNVACNKYDDDINSLNERLDKIEGTMALKTDLQAVQSTVNALNAINFDAFMKSADFASMLEKAGVSKNQILALIEGLQDADDVAATFDAMMEAYDIWGKIEAAMVEAFGGAEGADVKATIDAWLGAEFAEYMKSYDAKVAKDIEDANKALYDSIMEAISKGETTSAGLAVRIDAIEKAIEAFEALVFEVAGRIQSLVWVPNSLIQASTNMVKLTNYNITLTKGNARTVVPMWNPEVTMTWQVSPAAVASKIKAENLSIVTEEISRAAASYIAPEFEVVDFEAAKDGKITVTFKATTDLNKMNPEKAPMVALNVKMGSEEAGINFTSNYVALLVENETVSTSTFKYVNGEQAVAFGGVAYNEIEYTDNSKRLFLEGGFIGMQVNGKYVDVTTHFESLGENGWLKLVCTPEVDANKNLVAAKMYDVIGDEVTDKDELALMSLAAEGFGIHKSDIALIGNVVKSGAYTYSIEGEAGSYTLGTIVDAYEITTITTPVAVEAQKFIWTYDNATNGKIYTKEGLSLTGLTAAQYDELGTSITGGVYSGNTRLADAEIELTTTPTANTDVMWFDMTITDTNDKVFVKAGNYVAKFEKLISDCKVVITVPVVVEKGIVTLANVDLGAQVYTFDGQYVYELVADVKKAILEANAEVFGEQFTEENFEDFWTNSAKSKIGELPVYRNASVKLSVDFENAKFDTEYKTGYEVAYAGLKAAANATVKMVKPVAKFTANPYYVVDGRMEMITEFSQAGDEFDVIDKMITKAYAISGVEGAVLSYEIATDLSKFTGTKPEITTDANGDYILSWGEWNKLELELVAKATLNGVEVGSQKFVAYITDPVDAAIKTVKNADLNVYAGETKNVFSVLELKANDKNVFGATALDADLATALNASVIFETEELNPALSFDKTTGVFAVDAAGMNIQGDHPVTIKVVYTYTFGVREYALKLVVKSGTRPRQ